MALRRRHRDGVRPRAEQAGGGRTLESAGVDSEICRVIGDLPRPQREVVHFRYSCDMSTVEIAQVLGCSESAARVMLHRARRRLAEPLSGVIGTWMGGRRWGRDDLDRQLRAVGDERYRDEVLANVGEAGNRHLLTLASGAYLLSNGDGERLDHGSFGFRGRHLELRPWDGSGTVVFETAIDGEQLRLRQISNTTTPTGAVPDAVYVRLLFESEPFVWSGRPRHPPARVGATR